MRPPHWLVSVQCGGEAWASQQGSTRELSLSRERRVLAGTRPKRLSWWARVTMQEQAGWSVGWTVAGRLVDHAGAGWLAG